MALLNTQDKKLQAAALKAGIRTFEQTLIAGLGVGTVGGTAVGFTLDAQGHLHLTTSWQVIFASVVFLIVTALIGGLRAYLSMASSGIPQQYIDAALAAVEQKDQEAAQRLAAHPTAAVAQEGLKSLEEVARTPEEAAVAVLSSLAQSPMQSTAQSEGKHLAQ